MHTHTITGRAWGGEREQRLVMTGWVAVPPSAAPASILGRDTGRARCQRGGSAATAAGRPKCGNRAWGWGSKHPRSKDKEQNPRGSFRGSDPADAQRRSGVTARDRRPQRSLLAMGVAAGALRALLELFNSKRSVPVDAKPQNQSTPKLYRQAAETGSVLHPQNCNLHKTPGASLIYL